jgi:hypothetical protein
MPTSHSEVAATLQRIQREILEEQTRNAEALRISNFHTQALHAATTFNLDGIPDHEYVNAFSTPTPMPNQPPVTPRSLLYLLRRLKKEGRELVSNTAAMYWGWFNKTVNALCESQWKLTEDQSMGYSNYYPYLHQAILDRIGKITSINLVYNSMELQRDGHSRFWYKEECKSHWEKWGMKWTHEKYYTDWVNTGAIVWAADSQVWVAKNTNVTVWDVLPASGGLKFGMKTVSFIQGKHKLYQSCAVCEKRWLKTQFKFNKWIEQECCPACNQEYKAAPKNPPHTFKTIHGEYHSHAGKWTFHSQRTGKGDDKDLPMGVEIEMNLKSGDTTEVEPTMWDLYKTQIAHNPNWHNFYTERDGSLSSKGSVELITNPMTLPYHHEYWEFMLPEIRKTCVGWNVDKWFTLKNTSNYGIHITSHRKYWSDLAIARLMKFLELRSNSDFVFALAQRRSLYRGAPLAGNLTAPKIATLALLTNKKLYASEHYGPVFLKENNLMEIRIFNSTLNQESFLKNLEFVDAFRKWCQETAFTLDYTKFVQWLTGHYSHEKRYPNLLSYLCKDQFGCKHSAPVINRWKNLIQARPLGQLDLFELTAEAEGLEDRADVLNHQN